MKPGNIMIDKEGSARIMDFGIARSLGAEGVTAEGVIIGTPEYMSPEQVEGKDVDVRSDIYSLGIIFFEILTGRVPFEGDTPLAVAIKHKSETPPSPKMFNPQLPDDIARLILRCLDKDKSRRFQTAEELLAELRRIDSRISSKEETPSQKPLTSQEIAVTFRLKKILIPVAAFVAIFVIGIIVWEALPRKASGPPPAAKKSVAVLPFVDRSPDKSSELLADNISEALINALGRIKDLNVPGRTSAFSFKGKNLDAHEIGQKLNVQAVLEGSVQVVGEKLRVSAQLVNAEDGFQLWSEIYNRKMEAEAIFAIQDEIARALVDAMKVEILGDKKARLVKPATANLEAYNLYLQGRFFLNKRGKSDLLKSIDYFNKALAIDPKYALAYAGLADAYRVLGDNLHLQPSESYPKAKEFARKALEIDDGLDQARAFLAAVKLDYDWDFAGAESEFKKAIDMSPGDAAGHHQYAFLLSYLGRHKEAIKEIKLARDLDPLAPRIRSNVGCILYFARRYDEALEELKKALEFDPTHAATYEYIGDVYRELSRYEESIASFRTAKKLEDRPIISIKLAVTNARAGQVEEARKMLLELKERSKQEYVSSVILAAAYGALGERDIAFELLDKAYTERDSRLTTLKTLPILDSVRSDPRFAALLKKIGLEGNHPRPSGA